MRTLSTTDGSGGPIAGPTWDELEEMWLSRTYSGPSEKYDYREAWDVFRARHERTPS